eukprot:Plantae.Rhodophyta-Hildenbrandia_rubra.ctg4800.p1 GENE.Plantae.Rhodophyta-Hildenbrandia_rubra.ctg4800~~Plantae.Rhodophyta-Hildenbrandia_rubra.ctg4800.p1  ORF type:complete len:485 (-),score=57.80 Plantae.Rhodophyta-Hildenbrandia_rubra.ctg4800:1388-2842(-)
MKPQSPGDNAELRRTHFLILDGENPAALAVAADNGWSLPFVDSIPSRDNEGPLLQDVQRILSERHDVNSSWLFMLYKAYEGVCDGEKMKQAVDVVEAHDTVLRSDGAMWITRDNLMTVKLSPGFSLTRKVIENVLCPEIHVGACHRAPWEKPGWFPKVRKWIAHAVDNTRGAIVQDINPKKTVPTTRVLEIKIENELLYFKAVHPSNKEVYITLWLSKIAPAQIPKLLGSNEELDAMLMESFAPQYREGCGKSKDRYAEVYRSFGRLQLKVVEFVNEKGLESFPESEILTPRVIAVCLDDVLNNSEVQSYMSSEEIAECQALKSTWVDMCARLEDAGVPCSIVHGDLRKKNFARSRKKGGEALFFDWGLACFSHPFFQLRQLRSVSKVTEAHVESYLGLWTRFVPDMNKLKNIETLAHWVHNALKAVNFCRRGSVTESETQMKILRGYTHDRADFFRSASQCLRRLADATPTYTKQFCEENLLE